MKCRTFPSTPLRPCVRSSVWNVGQSQCSYYHSSFTGVYQARLACSTFTGLVRGLLNACRGRPHVRAGMDQGLQCAGKEIATGNANINTRQPVAIFLGNYSFIYVYLSINLFLVLWHDFSVCVILYMNRAPLFYLIIQQCSTIHALGCVGVTCFKFVSVYVCFYALGSYGLTSDYCWHFPIWACNLANCLAELSLLSSCLYLHYCKQCLSR